MGIITEETFPHIFNLIVLMFFVIMIFGLFGIYLFGNKFP